MVQFRETYNIIGTNAAQLNAGVYIVIEDKDNAEKNQNLPHNSFILTNQDTTCTLFLFLDKMEDQEKPDYVVFPSQQIAVGIEDGVSFSHLFVKNTHASSNIAANQIKYRVSTLKRVD